MNCYEYNSFSGLNYNDNFKINPHNTFQMPRNFDAAQLILLIVPIRKKLSSPTLPFTLPHIEETDMGPGGLL